MLTTLSRKSFFNGVYLHFYLCFLSFSLVRDNSLMWSGSRFHTVIFMRIWHVWATGRWTGLAEGDSDGVQRQVTVTAQRPVWAPPQTPGQKQEVKNGDCHAGGELSSNIQPVGQSMSKPTKTWHQVLLVRSTSQEILILSKYWHKFACERSSFDERDHQSINDCPSRT